MGMAIDLGLVSLPSVCRYLFNVVEDWTEQKNLFNATDQQV
jgi:hypothetical protein